MAEPRTIRPGELTAKDLAAGDTVHPELELAKDALGFARKVVANGGGDRPLRVVVLVLAAAFLWHLQGDGTLREEQRKTKVMVGWLVERDLAREHGLPLPPFPYDAL